MSFVGRDVLWNTLDFRRWKDNSRMWHWGFYGMQSMIWMQEKQDLDARRRCGQLSIVANAISTSTAPGSAPAPPKQVVQPNRFIPWLVTPFLHVSGIWEEFSICLSFLIWNLCHLYCEKNFSFVSLFDLECLLKPVLPGIWEEFAIFLSFLIWSADACVGDGCKSTENHRWYMQLTKLQLGAFKIWGLFWLFSLLNGFNVMVGWSAIITQIGGLWQ